MAPEGQTTPLEHTANGLELPSPESPERWAMPQDQLTKALQGLNAAPDSVDPFVVLATSLESFYGHLSHSSIVLFPSNAATHTAFGQEGPPHAPTPSKQQPRQRGAGRSGGGRGTATTDGSTAAAAALPPPCDWTNSCMYAFSSGRHLELVCTAPDWPLSCSAAYYATLVMECVLRTDDVLAEGPHFLDWRALSATGSRSMLCVPLYCNSRPIAALCLASEALGAFKNDDVAVVLCAFFARHVQALPFATPRTLADAVVRDILMPVSINLSMLKPEFWRMQGFLGADDPFSELVRREAGASRWRTATTPQESARAPSAVHDSYLRDTDLMIEASKHIRPVETLDHMDLSWSDFMFNLISMCIVYAYFSRPNSGGDADEATGEAGAASAAPPPGVHQDSGAAVLLCMAVAMFDVALLVARWLWADNNLHYGIVLCIFQIYRVFLLPFANTWMLWSLIMRLGLKITTSMVLAQAAAAVACSLLYVRMRTLFQVPLQLITVCLAACSAARLCAPPQAAVTAAGCIGCVFTAQLLLSFAAPNLLAAALDSSSPRSYVPHVQAKRSLLNV